MMLDVCIIGAGICGSFLAYDLSHYKGSFAVVEKEHDVAGGVTMANSAIIHAGYDPKDHTLKAQLNVEGAKAYEAIAQRVHAHYQKIGAYVIASEESQIAQLKELQQRGNKRGVRCELVSGEELKQAEPHVCEAALMALYVPDTAIIEPWEMALRLMECAVLNGVDLYLEEEVIGIMHKRDYYEVKTSKQTLCAKRIINAAGLGAERIGKLCDGASPFHMEIKRGQYYVLSHHARDFVHHILYPLPSDKGKGVLCVPTIHGNILLGPDAQILSEEDTSTTSQGLARVREQLTQLVKEVPYGEVIRSYSGCRPCGNDNDFYIEESAIHPGIYHLGCIDSPGLASAPAISRYVLEAMHISSWERKEEWIENESVIRCDEMEDDARKALIQADPNYGHIICRCEAISEGEILAALRRPIPPRSIKEVKKRVRCGMGKCQGGFCEVEVAKLLARESRLPLHEICYDGAGSELGEEAKG